METKEPKYNKFIPLKGFSAINLFGTIYARSECKPLPERTINHENIHTAQAKDCGSWLMFYFVYLDYWIRFGYRNNPFEREAYDNDFKPRYLSQRGKFAWKKYLNS